jgi:glycosyltransferase involved in cell wall biosynthesis
VDGVEWARAKWGRFARLYFKLMEAISLLTPNRVVADAEAIRDHLARRHSIRIPVSVLPYGASLVTHAPDESVLSEWGLSSGNYYLVVCRLEPENHVREMIEGFCATNSGRKMAIVGDHLAPTTYAAELRRRGDCRVQFLGATYERQRLEALRYHAFAYCHGHSVGGTNPSLLEALGCSNAVVAHDNAFNREVARDAALYFDSALAFSARVREIEADEPLRRAMKSRASAIISRDYTWVEVSESYFVVFFVEICFAL